MSRYVSSLELSIASDVAMDIITTYLSSNGFKQIKFRGEDVWEKRKILMGPQFIRIIVDGEHIRLEAWTMLELFPGVYFLESKPPMGSSIGSFRLFTDFLRQKSVFDVMSLAFWYRGTTACPRC